jgi:protein phosphatase
MRIRYYPYTVAGDRAINQDAMGCRIEHDWAIFLVADGLGGYRGGEYAANIFCAQFLALADNYLDSFRLAPKAIFPKWISEATNLLYRQISHKQEVNTAHTTCAILYLSEAQVVTAHLGDSRIYRLDPHKIHWRTRDHSIAQIALEDGDTVEDDMGVHPDQNRLTRSISHNRNYPPSVKLYPGVMSGETFLLCSDGFWSHTQQAELLQLAQPKANETTLVAQARRAIERAQGNSDNVTAQWVRID